MNLHVLPAALTLGVLLTASAARAADPTKQECVEANDAAQDLRQSGKLRQARENLAVCASASCPGVVRDDCTQRLAELDSAMPHIVFAAKDAAGNDLVDVKVTIDGARLADRLDGSSLKVDPGLHVFAFTWEGHPAVTKKLVLDEHDQARREVVVFGGTETPHVKSASPGAAPATAGSGGSGIDRKTIAFAVGGAGVAGLIVGGIFGMVAKNTYDGATSRCAQSGSSPPSGCPGDALTAGNNTAHQQATVSTVGFVAGAALLTGGAILYFTAPKAGVAVAPTVGTNGGGLSVLGTW
jgi:hypothetical protein